MVCTYRESWLQQNPCQGKEKWVNYDQGAFLFFVGGFLDVGLVLRGVPVPKRRYERREPTDDWQQLRPLLKDSAQIHYEIVRPVVLWGVTPKERAEQTGMSQRSIYYRTNLFDQAGMASLLPAEPPPPVPKQDKRALPPPIRQEIVDLHDEYPAFRPHEIATICFVKFGRRPSPQTIKLILASGPKPSRERRFKRFAEIEDPVERRRTIVRLHAEGWNAKSIAAYLDTSRTTVHLTLKKWAEEQFAGIAEHSRAPDQHAHKTTLRAMHEVKKLAENPELGAYRVSAALEQLGIKLSRSTCGRLLSVNRDLYHLQAPRKGGRPKAAMPFRAERRHQVWSVDIRYLDMHRLPGVEMVYCISILENFSRSVLASAISLRQDTEAFFAVLYKAVRVYGVPEVLVSDNGSVFTSHDTRRVCEQLGIEKKEIKKGKPYQNYIESMFNVQRRMADWSFEKAHTWEDLLAAHEKWMRDYNFQRHMAHEKRDDGCHSPAAVLQWIKGMQPEPGLVYRAFSAICETRTLTKAGYARFRNFLLYGEQGLAGNKTLINIFQDTLTLEYGNYPLSRYSVEWQPDDRHLLRVGNPRLYNHPYQSPQLSLWEPGEVEWFVIISADPLVRRRRSLCHIVLIQSPLWANISQG
jgi:putative transposase